LPSDIETVLASTSWIKATRGVILCFVSFVKFQQAVTISLDTYTFTGYVASNKKGSISMKNVVGAKKADAVCVEVMMWDSGKPQWE